MVAVARALVPRPKLLMPDEMSTTENLHRLFLT
jgi:ABC-type branched-subunit amino acid transport system ATPase component